MEQVLIITSSYDLPAAQELAPTLGEYRTYFFDPTLVDEIAKTSLKRPELLLWDDAPTYPELEHQAYVHVRQLEARIDTAMRPLLATYHPTLSLRGWQSLNLYYLMLGWQWYGGLWSSIAERLRDCHVHVLVCDNPANFYWPSFVPALLLIERLRTWNVPFSAVAYGERADESDVMMDLFGSVPEQYDVLTHLPTCFYDAPHFRAELAAAGSRIVNIEPKYWGMPMTPDLQVKMARLDHARLAHAGVPSLQEPGQQLLKLLHELLEPYIASSDYRARQAVHLAKLYQSQLASLFLLETYFGGMRPGRMLISDHDAGFHGPLLTYASRHRMPVYVLPHAKVSISSEFTFRNMTALTHVMQGRTVLDGNGRALRHMTLAYPEQLSLNTASAPLSRLGVLLSGLSLNGVPSTALRPYLDGLKEIEQWCRRHGVELAVRCRPGQSLFELITGSTDIARADLEAALRGSLGEFAQGVDVCLMYDAPTSAAIEFLRNGVPLLNPLPEALSTAEHLWSDAELIPRESLADTLRRLDAYVADTDLLDSFRRHQFARYAAGTAQARSLRSLL
ncbi:hypothetical protein [Pseudoduganella armeniaca]|uniref:Uncharacterized protein n=1 Tax=Pseudoduganella armeniaca TaxID=2072590 RepID=A0A2R4C3W6_9BURK|nr:hypothetical protein [Pseudoduganella armeniaca]AVR94297.1 hypothetical protein C9I28_00170 [Pseudoduganella armeniaca]